MYTAIRERIKTSHACSEVFLMPHADKKTTVLLYILNLGVRNLENRVGSANDTYMIQALDENTVRQLCAGQVLSSLKGIVKELIENSLDAGATKVEVLIESFGLHVIRVTDNGCGIPIVEPGAHDQTDIVLLARRATSKRRGLQETSTLSAAESCDSLGFRGEALHSLAQLADVNITTKTSSMLRPVSIWYDRTTSRTVIEPVCSTSSVLLLSLNGTVVQAKEVFANFPVRRMEMERNKKKQLQDATALVKQYALSRPDVRIIVEHQLQAGDATVTLCSTSGSGDVSRSLAEAYGGKLIGDLKHISWQLTHCDVSGLLSPVGKGRPSGEMQVFALDGRIVELPRVSKAILDAFREHHPNAAQRVFPVFFLQLRTNGRATYDVNLTPDKRKVLIAMEDILVEEFRREADKLFRVGSDEIVMSKQESIDAANKADDRRRMLTLTPVSHTAPSLIVHTSSSHKTTERSSSRQDDTPPLLGRMESVMRAPLPSFTSGTPTPIRTSAPSRDDDRASDVVERKLELSGEEEEATESEPSPTVCGCCSIQNAEAVEEGNRFTNQMESSLQSSAVAESIEATIVTDEGFNYRKRRRARHVEDRFPSLQQLSAIPCPFPISASSEVLRSNDDGSDDDGEGRVNKKKKRRSKAISAQSNADLDDVLQKSHFVDMHIHGQFNHGFIIASHCDDLYIIDQHASDEKYNYEQLMEKYVARPQPLVRPVRVAMDAHEAELALEHKAELRRHGFLVETCDGDACAVHVSSVPVLPYDTVTPHDVLELTQQLLQYGSVVKPIRAVWHSMATKACRSSIMIGTVLSEKTMRDIVNHLSTMHQPWNCPHGRPTLRHLGFVSHLGGSTESLQGV